MGDAWLPLERSHARTVDDIAALGRPGFGWRPFVPKLSIGKYTLNIGLAPTPPPPAPMSRYAPPPLPSGRGGSAAPGCASQVFRYRQRGAVVVVAVDGLAVQRARIIDRGRHTRSQPST